LRLVFLGTPEFAVPSLNSLLCSEHEIIAVVTQPDRRSGRGRHKTASPVKVEAEKAGLRVLQPLKVRAPGFISELRALGPSLIVVVAYGQLLPSEIIFLPRYGCVNIHASLLPKYRGAAPISRAIINGDKITGVTAMLMDEGMDTGAVLLQEAVEINKDDTCGSLSERLSRVGADTLIRTLTLLERGAIKPRPQVGDTSDAPLLKKADGIIDWSLSAVRLCCFIRGMNPWPGAYSFLDGERIKILKAVSLDGTGEAGVIQKVARKDIIVGTGNGLLSILELQISGKPVMTVNAFLQGRRLKEGMSFYEK
jgi:methionyl-tRNA formyltransferase